MGSSGTAGPGAVASELAALGATYAGVDYRLLTAGLFEALREKGLGVGVWTVNDAREMRRLASLGVDFITSDRPDLLREVLPR